jgi:hypothetical protein
MKVMCEYIWKNPRGYSHPLFFKASLILKTFASLQVVFLPAKPKRRAMTGSPLVGG